MYPTVLFIAVEADGIWIIAAAAEGTGSKCLLL